MAKTLSRQHRRFLIVEEIVGSTIVNFFVNGGIAWFLFHAVASVPLWGKSSIAVDTLATALVLPVVTALIARLIVRQQVMAGKLAPIPPAELGSSFWLRRSSAGRGALLGAAAVVLGGVPVVLVFALAGPTQLATTSFIVFKASFAAAVGAVVTPLLGWWALVDASRDAGELLGRSASAR
jgi:hypothetical protein